MIDDENDVVEMGTVSPRPPALAEGVEQAARDDLVPGRVRPQPAGRQDRQVEAGLVLRVVAQPLVERAVDEYV